MAKLNRQKALPGGNGGRQVSISEARKRFSKLLAQVESGQVVIITKRGTPLAELRWVPHMHTAPQSTRKAGFWKNRHVVISLDFDAPLPEFQEYM